MHGPATATLPPMTTQEALQKPAAVATVLPRTTNASRVITLIAVIVPFIGFLSAVGFFWGVALHPIDLILFAVLYVFCGFGITVGFHRQFSHKSFHARPWVRTTLAIAGCMAVQGPLIQWVTDHRKHHAMSDKEGDPHSPHTHAEGWRGTIAGFYHAHMGWLFVTKGMERGRVYGRDLFDDKMIRRVDRFYLVWLFLGLLIPLGVAWGLTGQFSRGIEAMVWAGLVRVFLFDHITWSVNSICHTFGRRDYETPDHSRNFWLLALPTFGEAWHNNHHAFPGSARHGLKRHQVDPSWLLIRGMEKMGWVSNVKLPTPERMARRVVSAHE